LGEIPFEVALLEAVERPVYQRIAEEIVKLARLGMRKAAIARKLGVMPRPSRRPSIWRVGQANATCRSEEPQKA
jgi:hypothetical protein